MVTIDCWIVRLHCIRDEDRLQFIYSVADTVLENHVIRSIQSRTVKECEDECYDELNCKSINWSRDNICELNSALNETKPADMKQRSGWMYKSTDYSSLNVSYYCGYSCASVSLLASIAGD